MSDDTDGPKVITDAQIEALIARLGGGDQKATILQLMTENHGYREQRRQLKEQIKDLEGKLPKEGEIVLGGDDSKLWKSYQELGKPEDLKKASTKVVELQGELDKRDQNDLLGKAASLVGFKPNVLIDLAESKGLAIEMREKEIDGEKHNIPFAKFRSNESDEMKPLNEFIESHLADYKPALASTEKQEPAKISFPTMRPSGEPDKSGATKAIVDRVRNQYATPSEAAKGA